jgi:CRP-like cAMP-binding protein
MHAATGEVVMCVEVLAGSLLGLPGLIGNVSYSLTATARKGSELDFIAREDFLGLMQTEPSLSLKVLHILAAEVRAARRALL